MSGVNPRHIMAVTFTNKAAREMRERAARLLGDRAEAVTLGTFHAICARILRIDHESAGLDRDFVIYDADDQRNLVKRTMHDLEIDSKRFGVGAVRNAISAAKTKLLSPADYAEAKANYFEEVVHRVYERYEELLTQSNALDFDDLLLRVVRLLERDEEVVERYRGRYVHVMIDEFQDTNAAQYRIARLIAGPGRRGGPANLFAVGDPDQSIYSWRQAEIGNILGFAQDYPGAAVIKLEQNYRSTGVILDAAGAVIGADGERRARSCGRRTGAGTGSVWSTRWTSTTRRRAPPARSAVWSARRGGGTRRWRSSTAPTRSRGPSKRRSCATACLITWWGPPASTSAARCGTWSPTCGWSAMPSTTSACSGVINVPARGIGGRTLDELGRWASGRGLPLYAAIQALGDPETAAEIELTPRAVKALTGFRELIDSLTEESRRVSAAELVTLVFEMTGYRDHLVTSDDMGEERVENVMELRSVAEEFEWMDPPEGLTAFLEQVALVSDTDNLGEKPDTVTFITLHQAKGLEFPVVFIAGMEEGVLPHNRSFDDPDQMDEERRLPTLGSPGPRSGSI